MKGQEVQEVLFFPPQPLRWATVLCTGLSRVFSRPSRAARLHCLPRSLQTKQGKGLGLYVGREQLFLPWLQPPSSSPPSYRGGNGKLGWQGRWPHTNQRRDSREKKIKNWGHSPLGCLRGMKDIGRGSSHQNTHRFTYVYTNKHMENHTQIYIFINTFKYTHKCSPDMHRVRAVGFPVPSRTRMPLPAGS